jgi:hypothetical protein
VEGGGGWEDLEEGREGREGEKTLGALMRKCKGRLESFIEGGADQVVDGLVSSWESKVWKQIVSIEAIS